LLPANTTAAPSASPLSTSFLGFVVSAESNRSAGAPCSIWVSSAADESVESVIVTPAFAVSKAVFACSSAFFSDAAAKIVSCVGRAAAPEHAETSSATAARTATRRLIRASRGAPGPR
jgi:hypothetical protein